MDIIYLRKIQAENFDEIYKHIEKDFPKNERPPYNIFVENIKNGAINCHALMGDDKLIGYAVISHNRKFDYKMIWYLAIIEEFRNQSYGSKLLIMLNQVYKESRGMFVEIERIEDAANDEDKEKRIRRERFYKKIGYRKLENYWKLYGVPFTLMYLNYDKDFDYIDHCNAYGDEIYRGFYREDADIEFFKED